MAEEKCNVCGKKMILKDERIVNGTKYNMYFCEECKRVIARGND